METKAEAERIAIPCEGCPLRVGSEFVQRKISFSSGGKITYTENGECGISAVEASGVRAERVRDAIVACKGPQVDKVRANTAAGRLGFQFKDESSCPAFPYDPTSSRQVADYFEGEN